MSAKNTVLVWGYHGSPPREVTSRAAGSNCGQDPYRELLEKGRGISASWVTASRANGGMSARRAWTGSRIRSEASRLRPLSGRSNALDQRLLRGRWAVRTDGLAGSEMPPMRGLPAGEPCAGKPHARFGGRGKLHLSRPLSSAHPAKVPISIPSHAAKRGSTRRAA